MFENYFIGTIIFTFLLSLFGLTASLIRDMAEGVLRTIVSTFTKIHGKKNFLDLIYALLYEQDIAYHIIATILLFVAGVLYIMSAEEIHGIYGFNKQHGINFRRPEKLAAAVRRQPNEFVQTKHFKKIADIFSIFLIFQSLTIFQAIIYGVTAFFITKS